MSSLVGVEARMYFLPHVYDHPQPYMWPTLMSTKEETKAARQKRKRNASKPAKQSYLGSMRWRVVLPTPIQMNDRPFFHSLHATR
jgi:hypothetical protein